MRELRLFERERVTIEDLENETALETKDLHLKSIYRQKSRS